MIFTFLKNIKNQMRYVPWKSVASAMYAGGRVRDIITPHGSEHVPPPSGPNIVNCHRLIHCPLSH